MRSLVLAVGFAMGVGCGDAIGQGNIAACKSFVTSATCGGFDPSPNYDCESYDSATCDISPYFSCLSMRYVCVDGGYDGAKVATVAECDPYVTCR